jgi:hypothetical protein
MLQSLRDYPVSTKFFERACATQENVLGKDHVITATGYHVLAKSYTLESDFPKALAAERIAYDVFSKKVKKKRGGSIFEIIKSKLTYIYSWDLKILALKIVMLG